MKFWEMSHDVTNTTEATNDISSVNNFWRGNPSKSTGTGHISRQGKVKFSTRSMNDSCEKLACFKGREMLHVFIK